MTDFLPNTDNFFKYLLTIGLLLIIFTIMYPIQKQQEVDLELISYGNDTAMLNFNSQNLRERVSKLELERKSLQHELDSLKLIKNNSSKAKAQEIQDLRILKKNNFESKRFELIALTDSLIITKIHINSKSEKIKKLSSYFEIYRKYKIALLFLGILLTIIGLRYWMASVYRDELVKDKEVADDYKSSFVRHLAFCERIFGNWIFIFLGIIIMFIIVLCLFLG